MKAFIKRLPILLAIVVTLSFGCYVSLQKKASRVKQELALEVLKDLYDFGSTEQLESNQLNLRTKVTEDVYNQLTYDNEERRLNTYLKFYDEASSVVVAKQTDKYIIYSLDCVMIESKRKFIFTYEVNAAGKISKVYEAELIGFIAGDTQWE